MATGKGALRIVGAGVKVHANFCLGLARGFRNAPKLYNDDTVRPAEKVTGFASGVKVAGKELGLGLYDGITGLVTQPLKGAEREGGMGFLKGFGKGIGGLVLKPAAGMWGLPGYMMQGVRVEMRRGLLQSARDADVEAMLAGERARQGEGDYGASTEGERRDVLARWREREQGEDLKGFWGWKKGKEKEKGAEEGESAEEGEGPSRAGWFRGKKGRASAAERRKKSKSTATAATASTTSLGAPPTTASSGSSSNYAFEDDEALERAIRESVQQTSTGDREEDARVEAAIRASLREMHRAAEQQGHGKGEWLAAVETDAHSQAALPGQDLTNITDEEYQALIEEAVRRSLLEQAQEQSRWEFYPSPQQPRDETVGSHGYPAPTATEPATTRVLAQPIYELPGDVPTVTATTTATTNITSGAPPEEHGDGGEREGDEVREEERMLRRTMEESGREQRSSEEEEERLLREALAESEREHRSHEEELRRQRTEEEIVLEYVMRQSLAEEEYRRAAGKGKGRGKGVRAEEEPVMVDEEEEDEDLRRALEESLRMSTPGGGGGAGPSRTW